MNRFFCLQAKSRRLQIYTVLRAISRLFSAIMQYRSKLNAKTRTQTLYQYLSPLVAEKEGFEPSRQLSHPTPLAGEPLRPLGYFSTVYMNMNLAEREGFEPPVPCDITGFQDQRLQPLGHLSVTSDIYYKRIRPECQVFTELFNDELTYESGTIRLRSRPPRCRT